MMLSIQTRRMITACYIIRSNYTKRHSIHIYPNAVLYSMSGRLYCDYFVILNVQLSLLEQNNDYFLTYSSSMKLIHVNRNHGD